MRNPREVLKRNATFGAAGWLLITFGQLYTLMTGEIFAAWVLVVAQLFWTPAAVLMTYQETRAAYLGTQESEATLGRPLGVIATGVALLVLAAVIIAYAPDVVRQVIEQAQADIPEGWSIKRIN